MSIGTIFTFILQVRKMRHREGERLIQGHTTSKSWDLPQDLCSDPQLCHFLWLQEDLGLYPNVGIFTSFDIILWANSGSSEIFQHVPFMIRILQVSGVFGADIFSPF